MATFDMTLASTAGVGADVLAVPTVVGNTVRTMEAILDIDAMITAGATIADGDVFQLLEVPAESIVIAAGAEIMKSFTASCTCNIDFGGGDDIIDGADITSTGFCAEGSNGQSNDVTTGAASLFTQFQSATDTIDCKIAGAAPATGRLRVYACVINCNDIGAAGKAADVDRDQLA